jgi:hypothetical protein
MTSSRSDWPAAPDFHPEFGFLCPSARKRRGLRLATAFLATTLAIGATMGFAVEHRTEEVKLAATGPAELLPEAASAADPNRVRETCNGDLVQGLATFFLKINSPCGSSKPRARHGARTANRVATVIIGRTEALPAATAVEPSQVDSGKAEGPASVATAAPERTASPKKPRTRTTAMALAASPAVSAYASVPRSRVQSYQPQYYQPYGDPFRSIAPQGGFAAASGRSWRQWP